MKSEMADSRWWITWRHLTLYDVITEKLYHLVEQAQGYRIIVYLLRSDDLTEREARGVFHPPPPPLYHSGGMS